MTSDDDRWAQQQIDMLLALGALVTLADPETGEIYCLPTEVLGDLAEGRIGAEEHISRRPRHRKEAQREWRVRAVMVVISVVVVASAALPAGVSLASKSGVIRVIDETDLDEFGTAQTNVPMVNVPVRARVTNLVIQADPAPEQAGAPSAPRRGYLVRILSPSGRHRAAHNSNRRPYNWRWSRGDAAYQERSVRIGVGV